MRTIFFKKYKEIFASFIHASEFTPLTGTLLTKKIRKKYKDKVYEYTCLYIQRVVYREGSKKYIQEYVPKSKEAEIKLAFSLHKQRLRLVSSLSVQLKKMEKDLLHLFPSSDLSALQSEAVQEYSLIRDSELFRAQKPVPDINSENPRIVTLKGDYVHSKNECIFANILASLEIPYWYEKELLLFPRSGSKKISIRPDFTIFVDNNPIYIELLGMMDKRDYAVNWEYSLTTYRTNGIFPGKNLVCFSFTNGSTINCLTLLSTVKQILEGNIPDHIVDCGL